MRHVLLKALSAVAIVLMATSSSFSSLAWDARDLDLRPEINDAEAVAEFTFTNTGDRPVTIRRVSSSCGCTATKADGEVYEPGDSGTIAATFTFGSRTGLEVKTIRVVTDDPDQAEHHLTMRVHIPAGLEIEPRFVYWNAGDAQAPKTIEVTAADHPMELREVEIDSGAFAAEIERLMADGSGCGGRVCG